MKGRAVKGNKNNAGRRAFLRASGLATIGGALGSICAAPFSESDARDSGSRAWWVKHVDRPTLANTNATFKRFSGKDMFALYPQLKALRDGKGSFQAEQDSKTKRAAQWMAEKKPGFSLADCQLTGGAWTVMHSARPGVGLLSWTRISVNTPQELGTQRYSAPPQDAAHIVKTAARFYGAGLVGIAPMNETYVNLQQEPDDPKGKSRAIAIEETDLPAVTDTRFTIPKRMKWVVAIAIPMDIDLLARTPTALADAASAIGYSHSAFVVSSLAEFIRGLGYQAIPSVNDTAQSIPFAIDAGIGELSRLNKLVTPEFGPAVRLCKVFTDLPMTCDKPIDFGLVEFCRRCKKCAQACPSRALSFDDEPSFKTRGPWNNEGHKAWFEDSYKCFQYWQKSGSACGVCLSTCPYTKGDHAWIHTAVKATASEVSATDNVFRAMDDAFGYGKQRAPQEWWTKTKSSARRG